MPNSTDLSPLPPSGPSPVQSLPPDQERLWGTLTHLLSFASAYAALGFIAPLIVFLVIGPKSTFVRTHSAESVNFQLTTLVWAAAAIVGLVFTLGLGILAIAPLAGAYVLFYLVVVIIAATRANRGEPYRYPLTIRFVKP